MPMVIGYKFTRLFKGDGFNMQCHSVTPNLKNTCAILEALLTGLKVSNGRSDFQFDQRSVYGE